MLTSAMLWGGTFVLALDTPALVPERPPRFTADVAIGVDALGEPTLTVNFSIPYDELQWIKAPGGYACAVEMTVVFEPRGSQPGFGDLWERRLTTRRFENTSATNLAVIERRSFAAHPGRYQVRVHIRDTYSQEGSSAAASIEVPDYSDVTLGFADLELGTVDGRGRFKPAAARRFGLEIERLAAQVALFDRRPGPWPRDYRFDYRVLDDRGEVIFEGQELARMEAPADPVIVRPDSVQLFLGAYVFEVSLSEAGEAWKVDRSFEVEESGPPRPQDLERLLEPLAIIADAEAIEFMRSLEPVDRAQAWDEFWKRRDPTPETGRNEAMIEFFRRVRHVSRHYRDYGPGWRTDRGRIYIKFGAPDQVESRPPTVQTPQLEIWYYTRLSRRFVFADHEGFGRYRLVGPAFD